MYTFTTIRQLQSDLVAGKVNCQQLVADAIHAIEAKKPKARYGVTFPTKLFAILKRIFPTSWMDTLAR